MSIENSLLNSDNHHLTITDLNLAIDSVIAVANDLKTNADESVVSNMNITFRNWKNIGSKWKQNKHFDHPIFRALYIIDLYRRRFSCFYNLLMSFREHEDIKEFVKKCENVTSIGCGAAPEVLAYIKFVRCDLECSTLNLRFIGYDLIGDWDIYIDPLKQNLDSRITFTFKEYKIFKKNRRHNDICTRQNMYEIIRSEFMKITENFYCKKNEIYFGKIIQFLEINYENWFQVKSEYDLPKIMPLAVMLLGANTPDRDETYTALCDKIKEMCNSYIVRLKSRDCTSLKKVLECIIKSIIPSTDLAELNLPLTSKSSLLAFDEWLNNKEFYVLKQIILIVEDIELFNVELLQSLIEITSARNSQYPFVLLIGLSSTVESLDGMLNNRSLMRVSKHFFSSASPSDLLNLFLTHLISEGFPIQLSSRLYSYIVNDMFMCCDYSISHLIQRYQYCLYQHTNSSSHSFWKELQLECKTYSELCSSNASIINVTNYHKTSIIICRWLLDLFSKFPESKLGTKFHQVFTVHLKCGLGSSIELQSNLELMKTLSHEEIIELINFANSNLSNEKENCPILSDFIENSLKLASKITAGEILSESVPVTIPNSRRNLKEQIFRNANKQKHFLHDFCNWLHEWLKQHLPHYSKLTGYEAFFMDNLETFRININPSIRENLKKGLSYPYAFVDDENLRLDSLESISNKLPDTCILYKQLIGFPRWIYLYDWLQAFAQIVEEKDPDSPPTKMTQCRFNNAVMELEFLGFVKRVKSKVDVMNNLTWGSVF